MRLIDANALFENLDDMMVVSPTGYIHGDTVADMIGDAPTVEAVPVRHGRWKGDGFGDYMCSLCGMIISGNNYKYCPYCGAKMEG